MSIQEVRGVEELPREKYGYYVRLRSDPRLLQHGTTGTVYRRRDGKPWEYDGLKPQTDGEGTVSLVPAHDIIGSAKDVRRS